MSLLHRRGVIWGDARADNIVVSDLDQVTFLDFGRAGTLQESYFEPEGEEPPPGHRMTAEVYRVFELVASTSNGIYEASVRSVMASEEDWAVSLKARHLDDVMAKEAQSTSSSSTGK